MLSENMRFNVHKDVFFFAQFLTKKTNNDNYCSLMFAAKPPQGDILSLRVVLEVTFLAVKV